MKGVGLFSTYLAYLCIYLPIYLFDGGSFFCLFVVCMVVDVIVMVILRDYGGEGSEGWNVDGWRPFLNGMNA